MLRARHLVLVALGLPLVPVFACGHREGSCKDFDDCTVASACPALRCICDDFPASFAPTCGHDGTCFTSLDCPELCSLAGSSCKVPPKTCDQFIPTACDCGDGGKTDHFAAAWACSDGSQDDIKAADCEAACADTPGSGGSGSTGVSTGASTSTL